MSILRVTFFCKQMVYFGSNVRPSTSTYRNADTFRGCGFIVLGCYIHKPCILAVSVIFLSQKVWKLTSMFPLFQLPVGNSIYVLSLAKIYRKLSEGCLQSTVQMAYYIMRGKSFFSERPLSFIIVYFLWVSIDYFM